MTVRVGVCAWVCVCQDEDNGYFTQEIRKSEGQPVDLEIFNAKCGRLRGELPALLPHRAADCLTVLSLLLMLWKRQ